MRYPRTARGLFDPRKPMQMWAEPNDDPNIPYIWGRGSQGYGLNGYSVGNSGQDEQFVTSTNSNAPDSKTVNTVLGVASVLGVIGLYEGFVNSDQTTMTGKVLESLSTGVIYSTGIGFIASKVMR